MKRIKFSHRYNKLGKKGKGVVENGDTATLLQVFEIGRKDLYSEMVSVDTGYTENGETKNYKLPSGKLLFLLFLAETGHLFPTIRPAWPPTKVDYYRMAAGENFIVEIKEEE